MVSSCMASLCPWAPIFWGIDAISKMEKLWQSKQVQIWMDVEQHYI